MRTLLLLTILLMINVWCFAQPGDRLTGKWVTGGGDAQVQIIKSGDKFSGKIVWLKKPNDEHGKPHTDDENPNPSLRKRPIIGLEILSNFTFSNAGIWEGGTIYDPKTGKTYSCKITSDGGDKIHVRGYVGISLLGRTETWTRVK